MRVTGEVKIFHCKQKCIVLFVKFLESCWFSAGNRASLCICRPEAWCITIFPFLFENISIEKGYCLRVGIRQSNFFLIIFAGILDPQLGRDLSQTPGWRAPFSYHVPPTFPCLSMLPQWCPMPTFFIESQRCACGHGGLIHLLLTSCESETVIHLTSSLTTGQNKEGPGRCYVNQHINNHLQSCQRESLSVENNM